MIDDIERIATEGEARFAQAATLDDLRALDTELLGKRSELSAVKQRLGSLDVEQRKIVGRAVNDARARLEQAADERRTTLESADLDAQLEQERLDLTEFVHAGARNYRSSVQRPRSVVREPGCPFGRLQRRGHGAHHRSQ